MSIRSRLLWLLLPPLIIFITMISVFFYYNWYEEIMASSRSHLKSIVITLAQATPAKDIIQLNENLNDKAKMLESELYQHYQKLLLETKEKLPITNLYIVRIEPVQKGEPVLLDQPPSEINKINDGSDKNYAYRQVYLLDASDTKNSSGESDVSNLRKPGEFDFSESDEHTVYFTKKALVTPTYRARGTDERFMTGYAPIIDDKGNVVALMAADFSLDVIDSNLNYSIFVILAGAAATIFLTIASVLLIANYISKPVQKLKNAALSIAAGNYEEDIQVEGPQEIVDLANTLNTMSECLEENIDRLRESSTFRERMYGEYECALLLQDHMLQKVIEKTHNPHLKMHLLQSTSATSPQGFWLKVNILENGDTQLLAKEALDTGFKGMYELVTNPYDSAKFPSTTMIFNGKFNQVNIFTNKMPFPFLWSTVDRKRIEITENPTSVPLKDKDYVFIYDNYFANHFENSKEIEDWFSKVLRHFGEEDFDLCMKMLGNELQFLAKRTEVEHDMHVICMQISTPVA